MVELMENWRAMEMEMFETLTGGRSEMMMEGQLSKYGGRGMSGDPKGNREDVVDAEMLSILHADCSRCTGKSGLNGRVERIALRIHLNFRRVLDDTACFKSHQP